jgi:hypothetical protein
MEGIEDFFELIIADAVDAILENVDFDIEVKVEVKVNIVK